MFFFSEKKKWNSLIHGVAHGDSLQRGSHASIAASTEKRKRPHDSDGGQRLNADTPVVRRAAASRTGLLICHWAALASSFASVVRNKRLHC